MAAFETQPLALRAGRLEETLEKLQALPGGWPQVAGDGGKAGNTDQVAGEADNRLMRIGRFRQNHLPISNAAPL